jgi:hypothetical protein
VQGLGFKGAGFRINLGDLSEFELRLRRVDLGARHLNGAKHCLVSGGQGLSSGLRVRGQGLGVSV